MVAPLDRRRFLQRTAAYGAALSAGPLSASAPFRSVSAADLAIADRPFPTKQIRITWWGGMSVEVNFGELNIVFDTFYTMSVCGVSVCGTIDAFYVGQQK